MTRERTAAPRTAAQDTLEGFAITGLGVAILSSDAVLIRLIDAPVWTVVFWRSALMALGFAVLLAVFQRRRPRPLWRRVGPADLGAGVLFAANSVLFVAAITHTAVANALLVIAAVPLATAFIARVVLGERVARRTWIAIAGALFGLGLILADGLAGGGGLLGEFFAFCVIFSLGGYFTVLRSGRATNPLPALILAGLLSAGLAALFADRLVLAAASVPYALLLGLVVMPASFTLISIGPRYLPAAEVSLVMLLEAVLGGLWAWLILAEVPTVHAVLGGVLVLGSVAWRALVEHRDRRG